MDSCWRVFERHKAEWFLHLRWVLLWEYVFYSLPLPSTLFQEPGLQQNITHKPTSCPTWGRKTCRNTRKLKELQLRFSFAIARWEVRGSQVPGLATHAHNGVDQACGHCNLQVSQDFVGKSHGSHAKGFLQRFCTFIPGLPREAWSRWLRHGLFRGGLRHRGGESMMNRLSIILQRAISTGLKGDDAQYAQAGKEQGKNCSLLAQPCLCSLISPSPLETSQPPTQRQFCRIRGNMVPLRVGPSLWQSGPF